MSCAIDLLEIAKGQLASEEKYETLANQCLFCDTNLFVLKVWSDYKYGRCDSFIADKIRTQQYDAYIITSPDFPWQDDPLREHPEPLLRDYFFNLYCEMVSQTKLPFMIVKGDEMNRLSSAIEFINSACS